MGSENRGIILIKLKSLFECFEEIVFKEPDYGTKKSKCRIK